MICTPILLSNFNNNSDEDNEEDDIIAKRFKNERVRLL